MESLLSLAIDNISSKEPTKIRKGLRQVEGLIAQICLPGDTSNPSSPTKQRRRSSSRRDTSNGTTAADDATPHILPPRQLADLDADPAFREFYRLQESFSHNLASQLVPALDRLLGHAPAPTTDGLILHALTLLQGLLLLHPPSRRLLAGPAAMTLLLDLLDPPATQRAALLTLAAALLACPRAVRAFERTGGVGTVAALYRASATEAEVKTLAMHLLRLYLMPETAEDGAAVNGNEGSNSAGSTVTSGGVGDRENGGSGSERSTGSGKSAGSSGSDRSAGSGGRPWTAQQTAAAAADKGATRTTAEKRRLLARHLADAEADVVLLRRGVREGVDVQPVPFCTPVEAEATR